jgi:hypothetical protein
MRWPSSLRRVLRRLKPRKSDPHRMFFVHLQNFALASLWACLDRILGQKHDLKKVCLFHLSFLSTHFPFFFSYCSRFTFYLFYFTGPIIRFCFSVFFLFGPILKLFLFISYIILLQVQLGPKNTADPLVLIISSSYQDQTQACLFDQYVLFTISPQLLKGIVQWKH